MQEELLKQILSEIKELKSGQQELKNDVNELKIGQQRIETKLDTTFKQVGRNAEGITDIRNKFTHHTHRIV